MSFRGNLTNKRVIFETTVFGIISVLIVYHFGLKTEAIGFAILFIFIYLIFSGRISEFKFMGFEAKIKDLENRPLEHLTEVFDMDTERYDEFAKDSRYFLDSMIIPTFLQDPKKIRVLKIVKRGGGYYAATVLAEYLKSFTHVVFLDKNRKLSGFATASSLQQKITEGQEFIKLINDWNLQKPIRKDIYVVKGVSRKQVLDTMDKQKSDVLPVVSLGLEYEGIIDLDTINSQIANELVQLPRFGKKQ